MSADLLPTEGTVPDFRRLAALVTLERYRVDPDCLWEQEDVAEKLWESQNGRPFPTLARAAMRAARYTGIKTPAGIGRYAAAVIA